MNLRKITSTTLLITLLVLTCNSIVLYIVPEGRVAYWADWRLFGLSKTQWGDQHVTVGFLFLVAGLLHLYYNWRTITAYLKNKARQISLFSGPLLAAVGLTALFVVGTYLEVVPFSTIVGISASIKSRAASVYGEPPYGHAELSTLRSFSEKQRLDLRRSLELLQKAGINGAAEEVTIRDLADRNKVTPQQVYEIIKSAAEPRPEGAKIEFPKEPEPGWGNLTLTEICARYHLDQQALLERLAGAGVVVAEPGTTVKEIAKANNLEPIQVFEKIRALVTDSSHNHP